MAEPEIVTIRGLVMPEILDLGEQLITVRALPTNVARATVGIDYTLTVKTGASEDVAGGVQFMKVSHSLHVQCLPEEEPLVRKAASEYLARVCAAERDAIVAEYGLPAPGRPIAERSPETDGAQAKVG